MPKKILIINPGNLFPMVMAFQDRVINLVKCLNEKHQVDIISLYVSEKERKLTEEGLKNICNNFYQIRKPNYNFFLKKIFGLLIHILSYITLKPVELFYPNWPSVRKKILKIIKKNNYDIIQIEAWWQCSLFKHVSEKTLKVIDTHDIMYEKRVLEKRYRSKGILSKKDKTFLEKYKKLELKNTGLADLIISISNYDSTVFNNYFPDKQHILIPIGQNIKQFNNYPKKDDGKTILFYGSMGGEQNIIAFWRLYNKIYPKIKKEIPEIKLIVLGANPPINIKDLDNGDSIIITDYVKDLREYIAKSSLMILPLVISGGFRSRIVEVMAMGVPVIGTHNALDGIGLSNSENCIIEDNNEVLASKAVDLLSNNYKLNKLSHKSQKFAIGNYSLEKTYGKLAEYYEKYIKNI